MPHPELSDFGWDQFFHSQLPDDLPPSTMPVRVMNVQKSGLHVAAPEIDAHVDAGVLSEGFDATVARRVLSGEFN
jgi:hypothetical protein